MEALEAVVSVNPLFSKTKYSTIPKKAEPANIIRSLTETLKRAWVRSPHKINDGSAMSCLKKAMETGGISRRTTFVQIKDIPQKNTGRITNR
jgi:hypothetical protein